MKKLFLTFILMPVLTNAKVDPPNYDFSLDKLKGFMPSKKKNDIDKLYGKGEFIEKSSNTEIYKYFIKHIRYKFPVFVQFYNSESIDFFARLPSYFSHDIFHQSLINRYGKQNQYFKKENSAVYIWDNQNQLKHYYSGQCTITCFPMYYSTFVRNIPQGLSNFTPLIQKFSLTKTREAGRK